MRVQYPKLGLFPVLTKTSRCRSIEFKIMKTLVRISEDNYSDQAYQDWKETIRYLVNELDLKIEASNNQYFNTPQKLQRYEPREKYGSKEVIEAIGYSKGKWQRWTIHYNKSELDTKEKKALFSQLVEELQKTFTHQHSYFVEKFEYVEVDGKKFVEESSFDCTCFSIRHTEFPENQDIIKEYLAIYGEDFDLIEVN